MEKTGTITFTSHSARAVFSCELVGQFSDGMWENSKPYDHWEFWWRLEVKVGECNQTECIFPHLPKKTNYDLVSLLEYVGDRMVKIGRMGKAAGEQFTREMGNAAKYMPATLQEWKNTEFHPYVAKDMNFVSLEMAEKFYATEYTEKDLKKDLVVIKAAMKNIVPV